ncbi:NAD(P)/FAD-dependent oxidoreductase [Castellaniella sp.]|uniref:NAD(P)/FAD-dependent oxidoreductase n=1 Tax=Castellaniella sp. TaxID=1955812 RepID=UPI003C75DB60
MQPYTDYASASGWNQIRNDERCPEKTLASNQRARFAIVGAGFAGAATARRLAECYPHEKIILLDALPAGEGAAGRSSGFMIDQAATKIDARSDGPQASWQTAILQAGLSGLQRAVDTHKIRCDWQEIGHYKTAVTRRGAEELERLLARLDTLQIGYRRLSGADARSEIGTAHCTHAVWIPNCVLVQPAHLIQGLLKSLPEQVELYTRTPVHRLHRGAPHTLGAGAYEIKADTVILCNNATLPFFGYGGQRQLTVYTYAGMTPELDDGEMRKLGSIPAWGATPVERLGATTRKLGSRRFLFRAGFSYKTETSPAAIRSLLMSMYAERYPDMKTHLFDHVWGGALSMTRNGAPLFGKVAPNVYALSACNASGILKMSALGTLLAEAIAGIDSPLLRDTEQFSNPQWIPPEPLRSLAVHCSLARMKRAMRY